MINEREIPGLKETVIIQEQQLLYKTLLKLNDPTITQENLPILQKGSIASHWAQSFFAARAAASYWQEIYQQDPEEKIFEIAAQLPTSEKLDLPITDVIFSQEACCLVINSSLIALTYKVMQEHYQGISPPSKKGLPAYTDPSLYLEDLQGNKCPVVFVNKPANEWLFITDKYYSGKSSMNPIQPIDNLYRHYRGVVEEKLKTTDKEEIEIAITDIFDLELRDQRSAFYLDLVWNMSNVEAYTQPNSPKTEMQLIEALTNEVANSFSTVTESIHDYPGHWIMTVLDALVDSLKETALSEEEKRTISYKLKRKLVKFSLQNYIIGNWLNDVFSTVDEDITKFRSIVYAIDIQEPWMLGLFTQSEGIEGNNYKKYEQKYQLEGDPILEEKITALAMSEMGIPSD